MSILCKIKTIAFANVSFGVKMQTILKKKVPLKIKKCTILIFSHCIYGH